MSSRPRVYIAGPISKGNVDLNVQRGIEMGLYLLDMGWAPFIPHASHHMDETAVVGTERYEHWLETDFAYIATCHALLRLPGESEGADREVAYAQSLDIPVYYDVEELPNPATVYDRGEQDEVIRVFSKMLWHATKDGGKKRAAGVKPPWYVDGAHEAAIWSHVNKWKHGEKTDKDSGSHPLIHLAWRALAIAYQETYGTKPPTEVSL